MAVTSEGDALYCFLQGPNNTFVFAHFLQLLVSALDARRESWRQDHVLQLDNSLIHRNDATKRVLSALGVSTTFTSPASYNCVVCEQVFGILKSKSYDLTALRGEMDGIYPARGRRRTNAQVFAYGIAQELNKFPAGKIQRLFRTRLARVAMFVSMAPI